MISVKHLLAVGLTNLKNPLIFVPILFCLAGRSSVVFDGVQTSLHSETEMKTLMPSFMNATDDDHAGSALTEMTATALLERGIPLLSDRRIKESDWSGSGFKRNISLLRTDCTSRSHSSTDGNCT